MLKDKNTILHLLPGFRTSSSVLNVTRKHVICKNLFNIETTGLHKFDKIFGWPLTNSVNGHGCSHVSFLQIKTTALMQFSVILTVA